MYWPGNFFNYYEGHTSVGTTGTAQRWAIASGDGDPATQTFVLLANTDNGRTGGAPHHDASGFVASLRRVVNLPPNSRTTVELTGMPPRYGVLVTSIGPSPVELVVEPSVYRTSAACCGRRGRRRRYALALEWPATPESSDSESFPVRRSSQGLYENVDRSAAALRLPAC